MDMKMNEKFDKRDFGFITDVSCIDESKNLNRSYSIWSGMIARCYNKNNTAYKTYGGRGVKICEEWRLYSNFKKWYDENYIEGFQIDKDYGGGMIYSPQHCVFLTKSENSREMMSRRDHSLTRGELNPCAKTKEYYETHPTRRADFKESCELKNWDFEKFEEIWNGDWFVRKDGGGRARKFLYIESKDKNFVKKIVNYDEKEEEYYENNPIRKSCFKTVCKRKGWNFDDFDIMWNGCDYTVVSTTGKKIKLYTYKRRGVK